MKNRYNLLVKRDKEKSYLISGFIATKLSNKKFLELKTLNPKLLGDYDFLPYNETDFSWWQKVTKYLTSTKIVEAYFTIDYWGNVTKY